MSWSLTTYADDLNVIPPPSHEQTLHIGQKAPFSGILMDMYQLRYFKTREFEADRLSKLAAATPQNNDTFMVIVLSAAAGVLLFSVVDSAVRGK